MKWIVAALVIWFVWHWLRSRPAPLGAVGRARALLGVASDADADAIRAAHRRLVTAAHPDRGGSDEEARRLNAARDLLLSRAGRTAA